MGHVRDLPKKTLGVDVKKGFAAEYEVLATRKKARVPIVISANASPETRATAAELAAYLERISGAKFAVTNGPGTAGIVLGTLAEFPQPDLAKPLEIRNTYERLGIPEAEKKYLAGVGAQLRIHLQLLVLPQ